MERKTLLVAGLVVATGVVLTIYGVVDPSRKAQAMERQQNTAIDRGIENYATLCFPCHGTDGKGAVVPGSDPPRVAPQLNRDQFANSYAGDPDEFKKTYDLVEKTIIRGRPGTPMPAWGQSDGGTLNVEQIAELATFITHADAGLGPVRRRDAERRADRRAGNLHHPRLEVGPLRGQRGRRAGH
jgi:mono/diheme cytochrome c family protein